MSAADGRAFICGTTPTGVEVHQPVHSGWLYKWASYLKGYQKRWFVLQNGTLAYYRSQVDVARGASRGSISILNTLIHTQDSCCFIVSNGSTQTYHLKCSSRTDRQRWVTAIELAKVRAIDQVESDEYDLKLTDEAPDKNKLNATISMLGTKLENVRLCHDLVGKHGTALQKQLAELEHVQHGPEALHLVRSVNERASLFRITVNALINASDDYMAQAKDQGNQWIRLFFREHEQRCNLEDMVEQLGKQHSHLEKRIRRSLIPASLDELEKDTTSEDLDSDCDDCFFDALDCDLHNRQTDSQAKLVRADSKDSDISRSPSAQELTCDNSDADCDETVTVVKQSAGAGASAAGASASSAITQPGSPLIISGMQLKGLGPQCRSGAKRQRRSRIPEKPNVSLNVWSIMKNCVGKELSKMPLPVNFNEPLSFLQRLTEDFEYSECLDRAAECDDSCQQMAYIAAFTVSAYANTTERIGKPFNPLLGETYECDRTQDYGWRSLAEQVSHHPPMVAMHTEGEAWVSWQEFTMTTKFRGKYIQIEPLGIVHLAFPRSGHHYTWHKVMTTVHNIIVGQLWVDNHGETDIVNHMTGDHCHLKYNTYSYFSRDTPRKVTGIISDRSGVDKLVVTGCWDSEMSVCEILPEGSTSSAGRKGEGNADFKTSAPKRIWQRKQPPADLVRCYNFTQLAVELNEPEDGVAPTDSRRRPDQRLMEEGRWDEANAMKMQLEEKQRAARRRRDSILEEAAQSGQEYSHYEPKWFRREKDAQTGNLVHLYTGEYWACKEKQDWSRCPDTFL